MYVDSCQVCEYNDDDNDYEMLLKDFQEPLPRGSKLVNQCYN